MKYKKIEKQLNSIKKLKFINEEHKHLLFRKLVEEKSMNEYPARKPLITDEIFVSFWRRTINVPVPIAFCFVILFTILVLSHVLPKPIYLHQSGQESPPGNLQQDSVNQAEVQSVYIQVEYLDQRDGKLYRDYGVQRAIPPKQEGEK